MAEKKDCTGCLSPCIFLRTGQCRMDKELFPHNRKQKKLFQTGDIACTHSDGFLGKSINFISAKDSPDKKSEYNHSLLLTTPVETFECLWRVERHNIFKRYAGQRILVGRYSNLTHEIFKKAFAKVQKDEGNIYPVHRLFLHAIGLSHIFHWKRLVCSEEVGKLLYYYGARHHKYFGTTPDMIADEIKRELNDERTGPKYEIVFEDVLPHNYYVYCKECDTHFLYPEDDYLFCHYCGKATEPAFVEEYQQENTRVLGLMAL